MQIEFANNNLNPAIGSFDDYDDKINRNSIKSDNIKIKFHDKRKSFPIFSFCRFDSRYRNIFLIQSLLEGTLNLCH